MGFNMDYLRNKAQRILFEIQSQLLNKYLINKILKNDKEVCTNVARD